MSETTSASPKKASASAGKPAKKARTTPNHPKVSEMVNAAISNLKERGGSSLQAIKKYIGANYSVDVEKIAPFIRKYLKTAVTNGTLIQTKGKGASGSFKLGSAGKKTTADKAESVAVKKPVDKKPSVAKAKEAKSAAGGKVAKAKSPSKSLAKKSPSKGAKKASKEKVKKTPTKAKTPKPKKAASKSTAKSAAAPKQESTTAQAD